MPLNLLGLQKELGCKVNDGGICHGIAHMAIQAIIRDDLGTYIKRIHYLDKVLTEHDDENTAIQAITNKITSAEEKRLKIFKQKQRPSFNNEELILLNIRSWLDGVQIYQGSSEVLTVKSQNYELLRAQELFYKNSHDERDRSIFLITNELGMLTREWMSVLFLKIKYSKEPIAYSISSPEHIIAVGKSSNFKSIYLINHDKHRCITDEENLYLQVLNSFGYQKTYNIALSISKFSYKNQKVIYRCNRLTRCSKHLGKLLNIAMMENNIPAIYECLKQINKTKGISKQELLAAKDNKGYPGLHIALQNGHAEAIKVYIKTIVETSGIGIRDEQELLATKAPDGHPGLFMALRNGHAEAIKVYIETIVETSRIGIRDKQELLAAKAPSGYPGLFVALQLGHSEAVSCYLKNIKDDNGSYSELIMSGRGYRKNLKNELLKWAENWKVNTIKSKENYPLLYNLLNYNRRSKYKEITKSLERLKGFGHWEVREAPSS